MAENATETRARSASMIASPPRPDRAPPHPISMAKTARRAPAGSTRKAPATPPSAPQKHLDVFANPAAGTRLRHRVRDPRVHLQLPAHRPARLRPVHDRDDRRRPLRRAEEPEALHVELSRRGRVPRGGDQPDPRRHRRREPGRASPGSGRAGTCAAASTPTWWPSTGPRAGSRPIRSGCRRCRSTARRPETGAAARSNQRERRFDRLQAASSSARRPTCS